MYRVLFFILFLFFSPIVLFAQTPQSPKEMQKEMQRMERERKQMEETIKKQQQEDLERLRKEDPNMYKQMKASLDRSAKIEKIISLFAQGKISDSAAEKKLYPLVKQDMQSYIDNLEETITRLENKLNSLKKAKRNPGFLIKKRIDEMLGRTTPSPDDFMYY